MSKNTFEVFDKDLPEYLDEFFQALKDRIVEQNEKYGDTWKERGLFYNGESQEERFYNWAENKFINCLSFGEPLPWLDFAGESFIGYIREKYLKEEKQDFI